MNDATRCFRRGPGELVVLGMLAHRPMHGYRMFRTLCESDDKIVYALCMNEGTLYPLLYRLERKGLVAGAWEKAGLRRRRRHYHITAEGRREYQHLGQAWHTLVRAVGTICAFKEAA